MRYLSSSGILLLVLAQTGAQAGEVDVIDASAQCENNVCRISATLKHGDTGWDHYANHWRVLTADGTEIARRVLYHPHETEQPFTRSLSGVKLPPGTTELIIEANDSVHHYGGQTFRLTLGNAEKP